MARKRKRRAPRVPRGNVAPTSPRTEATESTAERAAAPVADSRPGGRSQIPSDYSHVRKDLVRIAIFGTLIFGGMIGLRLVGV